MAQVNFCFTCGAALINNPNYCTRCGCKVSDDESSIISSFNEIKQNPVPQNKPNEITNQTISTKGTTNYRFQILSFLALILFSFIAFETYQFMQVLVNFETEYHAGNSILNLFVRLIKNESTLNEEQLASVFVQLRGFGYLLLWTNVIKGLVSFLNAFVQKPAFPNCISFIFFIEVLLAAILIGINPFEDYCKVVIVIAIPNLIGFWLLKSGQKK